MKARGPPGEEDRSIAAQLMRLRDPRTGRALADEYLLPQMSVLFWAGFDTTGNTMAWTLYCISQHPQVGFDMCLVTSSPSSYQLHFFTHPVRDGVFPPIVHMCRPCPASPWASPVWNPPPKLTLPHQQTFLCRPATPFASPTPHPKGAFAPVLPSEWSDTCGGLLLQPACAGGFY